MQDPKSQLERAILALKTLTKTTLIQHSAFYTTQPVGPQDQPDFINAVAQLNTTLSPQDLLTALQAIENQQQRARTRHWGARTLDLDILLYGDQTVNTPKLTIPHPHMLDRDFVLTPLLEIAPNVKLPNGQYVKMISHNSH